MHRLNSIDSQPSQRPLGCCPASNPPMQPGGTEYHHPIWGWIKSHQVFIQAIIVWMLVCLPYNIVTLVLYGKVTSNSASDLKVTCLIFTLFEIFIFCPKLQLSFPKKIIDFFLGEKLVKLWWFWTFWLLTTLISREKLSKKFWVKTRENVGGLSKLNFWTKI